MKALAALAPLLWLAGFITIFIPDSETLRLALWIYPAGYGAGSALVSIFD